MFSERFFFKIASRIDCLRAFLDFAYAKLFCQERPALYILKRREENVGEFVCAIHAGTSWAGFKSFQYGTYQVILE